jgi:hypothetical protein
MSKIISKVWAFPSDSNPNIEYETLQYEDGTTSCNCKGWTRRTALDGSRSCKHTRQVDMGTADGQCKTSHQYKSHQPQQPRKEKIQNYAKEKCAEIPQLGRRKFAV